MKEKKFLLPEHAINPNLAPHRGGCIASDSITVHGYPVGRMYRDEPDNDIDSGWRFLAGQEPSECVNDPDYLGVYDVNTIANYDSDIIPFLDADFGSAFERQAKSLKFVSAPFPQFDESEERSPET
jgi:hypothetical protein